MMTTLRNSIQDGLKFYNLCQRFPPMISWKVCTNWEYVSPHNSKLYWNCTIWWFIKSKDIDALEILTPGTGELKQEQWSREWAALKEEKVLVTSGKKKASVRKQTNAVSGMRVTIVHNNQTTMPPHLLSHPCNEVEVCRRKEVFKAKVTMVPFSNNREDIIWRGLARDRFVNIGILPSVKFTNRNGLWSWW